MGADAAGSSSLSVPELQRQLAKLSEELRARKEAENFALQREEAFADILSVINGAKGDVSVVFGVLIERATKLCSAAYGYVWLYDGERARPAASYAQQPFGDWLRARESTPSEITPLGQTLLHHRLVHVVDATAHEGYRAHAGFRELVDRGGVRTLLHVPLCKDEELLGVITVYRQECDPFSDRQISLMQSFAAQAVITIENARLLNEQREALEQQAATAEVLQVINSSPGQLEPVFNVMLEKAMALCGAAFGFLTSYDGQRFSPVAMRGVPPPLADYFSQGMDQPSPGEAHYRILQGEDVIHNLDQKAEEAYQAGLPLRRAVVDLGGARSALVVALRKDDAVLGALTIYRKEVRPFSEKEIELMRNFAAQAVVAIENARLMNETRDALERQTATTEVLKVINSSPGNLAPVFDAVLANATRLCDAAFGILWLCDGERFHAAALHGAPQAYAEIARVPQKPLPTNPLGRLLRGERLIVSLDVSAEESYRAGDPVRRALVDLAGARSVVQVALTTDGGLLGSLTVYRQEVRAFSDKQIALLQNFAAQAVIAMENARLLTQQREALERQIATTEVLETINRSPGDLQPVFEAILAKAMALCEAAFGTFATFDGKRLNTVATRGVPEAFARFRRSNPPEYGPGTGPARLIAGEAYVHDIDAADSDAYRRGDPSRRAIVDLGGARTILNVALRKDERLLGTLSIYRSVVRPFSDNQIALLQGFAAQAVIAMDNARLLTEQREALDQQTATAEVLQVINSSPGDLAPVFDAMLDKALKLCGAAFGVLWTYDGDYIHATAVRGATSAYEEFLKSGPRRPDQTTAHGRLLRGSAVEHILDVADSDDYRSGEATPRALVDLGGGRTLLAVPLRKEGAFLGDIVIYRREVQPFTDKEILVLQSFAAQAVIAMENARLLNEQREALKQQTATAEVLQVINSSPGNLATVFDTILDKAHALCDVAFGSLELFDGTRFRAVASRNVPEPLLSRLKDGFEPGPNHPLQQLLAGADHVQVADMAMVDDPIASVVVQGGHRTVLSVALRKDRDLLGRIVSSRIEVRPFTEKEIRLLESFAAQAVMAMENARLLSEIRQRQAELHVTFDNMGDGVAMFDADLRLAAWNRNFQRIMDVDEGYLADRPTYTAYLGRLAEQGEFGSGNVEAELAYRLEGTEREMRLERTRPDGTVIEVRRNPVPGGGFVLIYSDITERKKAETEIAAARDAAEVALERQTATADILKVIASSPTDVQPVLDAIAKAAQRFCKAADALICLRDGDEFIRAAHEGSMPSVLGRSPLDRSSVSGLSILECRTIHISDMSRLDREEFRSSQTLAASSGARAALAAPMSRDGSAVGCILLRRADAGSFAPAEIELLEAFAAQAVIAIENVRLFNELQSTNNDLKEALGKETATSEILRVISGSPTDVEPVFRTILVNANTLCDASFSLLWLWEGEVLRAVAHEHVDVSPKLAEFIANARPRPHRHTPLGLSVVERTVVHVEDVLADPRFLPEEVPIYRLEGARSILAVPMIREGVLVGVINIWRREPGAFTDGQIALVQTFAAQAVIAIENVRLFTELRDALEQQTATGEILRVIAQSPTDVKPVLDAVAKAALRFCGANDVQVCLREAEKWFVAVHLGPLGSKVGERRILDRQTGPGRAITDGKTVHLADVQGLDTVEFAEARKLGTALGFNSALCAPMLRDEVAIGGISLRRPQTGSFSERQIALLESFAAQAVIAIENVRLFTELREALEQQTATADILRVISQSPTDVGPVLKAVAKAALKFCNARDALVALRDGDSWVVAAHEGPIEAPAGLPRPLNRASVPGRAILDGDVVQVTDFQSVEADEFPLGREISALRGFRAAVAAPLLLDNRAIGAISLRRTEPGAFTSNQVELLKSFAAQAVIAIENVRLFTELRDSLERLKAAQANLIQAEKMASLGQLSAGIAHEIKNPLNFVNNFAGLSNELLVELKQTVDAMIAEPNDDKRAELQETMELLNSNLSKILEHGRRADGIVKSMLAHSRGGTGDWQTRNINALVEEALNLAYHGARAQDQGFNVTLDRDFDKALKPIDVVPQDVTRVFLNLFGNGFYATRQRQRDSGADGYRPTLRVSTCDLGDAVEVRVRDNGIGIAPNVRDKLFQPFFTTKPTGEGTGLGLSISYDIVTQQHGGTIDVESEPGSFTEFIVRLPRSRRPAQSRATA